MRRVIVSCHPATVAWLKEGFPEAEVLSGNATLEDVRDAHVLGNVPLALAAEATYVTAIEFDGPPPRGEELTEVEINGIHLVPYVVQRLYGSIPNMDNLGRCTEVSHSKCDGCAFEDECMG